MSDKEVVLSECKQVLLMSALNLDNLSQRYCQLSPQVASTMESQCDEYSCQWYHAAWGYCRFVGLIQSPNIHKDMFLNFFSSYNKTAPINILISGAADFTIVDHLADSLSEAQLRNTTIMILDMCATPLLNCEWYNEYRKSCGLQALNLVLLQKDILDSGCLSDFFDVVTTYRFLSKFSSEQRKSVINEWRRVLKPGGSIITSEKVIPDNSESWAPTKEQITRYVEIASKAISNELTLQKDEERILSLIEKYATNIVNYTYTSVSSFKNEFDAFIKTKIHLFNLPGQFSDSLCYAVIQATK